MRSLRKYNVSIACRFFFYQRVPPPPHPPHPLPGAVQAAEETLRNVVESVIETASGGTSVDGYLTDPLSSRASGYFSEPEARIIDHMMFGMSSPNRDDDGENGDKGGDDSAAAMGYSEVDLSTQFGRDAARGHHIEHSGAAQRHQRRLLELGSSDQSGEQEEEDEEEELKQERPRMLALTSRARLAIRSSIMRTSKAVPSMRFPQMMACGMVFACRAVTANPWCCAAGFVGAR